MTRAASPVLLAILLVGCASTPRQGAMPSLASTVLDARSAEPLNHAIWGVLVEEDDGRVLYSENADKHMTPASNRKLFAAATAADCWGLSATIPTEIWADGEVAGGTLRGDIVIKGWGDPSLGGRYYDDRDLAFEPGLRALRDRGIVRIEGNVVADVSAFDRNTIPDQWEVEDIRSNDGASVDALAFNENVVGVRIDPAGCPAMGATTDPPFVPVRSDAQCSDQGEAMVVVDEANTVVIRGVEGMGGGSRTEIPPVGNPALYAAQALDDFLRRSGVVITGQPAVNSQLRRWRQRLAVLESPPLFMLLATVLEDSQNLYAEMLLKRLAAGEAAASYADALTIERRHLVEEVGVLPDDFLFKDGSGLAVTNVVTPRAVVTVLRHMARNAGAFEMIMARPGENGTLRRRLPGLKGRVFAKTGSLSGVSALSGWITMPGGKRRFFSVIVNHDTAGAPAERAAIDRIVERIAME